MTEDNMRPIPGSEYEGYFADRQGNIISVRRRTPRIMKSFKRTAKGDLLACLCARLGRQTISACPPVGRLVLMAFVPQPSAIHIHAYIDGNKSNVAIDNLKWVLPEEVQSVTPDAPKSELSRIRRGTDHYLAKLNPEAVREIRSRIADGECDYRIGKHFDVSSGAIHAIRVGRTWKHVECETQTRTETATAA